MVSKPNNGHKFCAVAFETLVRWTDWPSQICIHGPQWGVRRPTEEVDRPVRQHHAADGQHNRFGHLRDADGGDGDGGIARLVSDHMGRVGCCQFHGRLGLRGIGIGGAAVGRWLRLLGGRLLTAASVLGSAVALHVLVDFDNADEALLAGGHRHDLRPLYGAAASREPRIGHGRQHRVLPSTHDHVLRSLHHHSTKLDQRQLHHRRTDPTDDLQGGGLGTDRRRRNQSDGAWLGLEAVWMEQPTH